MKMKKIIEKTTKNCYKDKLEIYETELYYHFFVTVDGVNSTWKVKKEELNK